MSKKNIIITTSWDDGYPLDHKIANLLNKYELEGTFYIPLASDRSVMTKSQIREIASRFEVGAHTTNHSILTQINNTEAKNEIEGAKHKLEDITGKPCSAFCFPSGRFTNTHIKMVSTAGFKVARTVELLSYRFPKKVEEIWMMPTTFQAFPHVPWSYLKNGLKRFSIESLINLISCYSPSWIRTGENLSEKAIILHGVFHLWGHSWEIQENYFWGNLEEMFKNLHNYRDYALYLDNSGVCSDD